MSYIALYRKFRPDCFADVKGQEPIVTTLQNQIKANRVGHAYLFCGTRGTGKTTVAKLFAKAINCAQPIDGEPCGTCDSCRSIREQTSMNVIEIDAASNNGVDNIREIVEEVRYSPTEGRYKVYIIDEVHMLSAGAFNALLKTLEEPPAYVVFILATTEAHKIPVTILSRCQRYDFRRITVDTIAARLRELTEQEGVETEEKALRYLARMADGALRDALSLLDRCMSFYYGEKLTYDKVLSVLGTVDVEVFARLLRFIRKGAVADCIALLDEITVAGRELTQFTVDFTWYLRNLLLLRASEADIEELLGVSGDQLQLLRQEAAVCDTEFLMRYIRVLSELTNQLRFAVQRRTLIELALVKLCCPQMETDTASLAARIEQLEERLAGLEETGVAVRAETGAEKPAPQAEARQKKKTVVPQALPEELQRIAKSWSKIASKTSPTVRTILISARLTVEKDNSLLLLFENETDKACVDRPHHMEELKAAIEAVSGRRAELKTKLIEAKQEQMEDYPDLAKLFKGVPVVYEED